MFESEKVRNFNQIIGGGEMPFLTEQDPRGKVKGSRDPLGFEVIWGTFGRRIICNLTTITSSLESFATLLLGHYLANDFASPGAPEDVVCRNFIRFEQIAAYSLLRYGDVSKYDPAILGILRARKRYAAKNMIIGADSNSQILSNQRAYGTWGLYSTAVRETGFLESRSSHIVSRYGKEVCEKCWLPKISPFIQELRVLVVSGGNFSPHSKHEKLALALAKALLSRDAVVVKSFYLPLAIGGKADKFSNQQILYEFMCKNGIRSLSTRDAIDEALKKLDSSSTLHARLSDCREVEKILSCCQAIFGFLLTKNDSTVENVLKDLCSKGFDFSFLDGVLTEARIKAINEATGAVQTGSRLDQIQHLLRQSDFRGAVDRLFALNAKVMELRGGGAWGRIEQDRLKVKSTASENNSLPDAARLPSLWYNSYFIDSLRDLASALAG